MKKYFQAPWDIKDILVVFVVSGLLIFATQLSMDIFGIKEQFEGSRFKSLFVLGVFLLQWILIMAPVFIVTLRKYGWRSGAFGFKKVGFLKTLKLVASGYFTYIAIIFAITLVILNTNIKIPGYQIQERILPMFGGDILSLSIAGIVIVVVAPIIEEMFFRGFLLRSLSNKVGVVYGSIISAVLFAVFHMQWQSIVPIFILGLIINSVVIKSKSIYPAIFFHMFNNLVAFSIEILILKEVIVLENIV